MRPYTAKDMCREPIRPNYKWAGIDYMWKSPSYHIHGSYYIQKPTRYFIGDTGTEAHELLLFLRALLGKK